MKICFVVNKFVIGAGISEYLVGLLDELKKKHKITLLTPEANIKRPYVKKVNFSVNVKGLKFFFPYKTGELEKYELVVSAYPTITSVKTGRKISKKQGIPHIVLDMGVAQSGQFQDMRTKTAHWVGVKGMKSAYKNADKVLTISDFLRRTYIKPLGIKSHVVLGGIKYKDFQKKYNTKILRKLKLKKGEYALFVGRASRHKGIHLVDEAFKKIGYPIKFVAVAGTAVGEYRKALEELKSKDFVFVDKIISHDERNELYQNCMFFVSGSLWEGLNMVVLEPQACGKPVVAFDMCATPEVVINGKTALLTKPGDINDLAKAMKKLIDNPKLREKMGKEAKKWAKKFDWSIIAKNFEKEFKKALA